MRGGFFGDDADVGLHNTEKIPHVFGRVGIVDAHFDDNVALFPQKSDAKRGEYEHPHPIKRGIVMREQPDEAKRHAGFGIAGDHVGRRDIPEYCIQCFAGAGFPDRARNADDDRVCLGQRQACNSAKIPKYQRGYQGFSATILQFRGHAVIIQEIYVLSQFFHYQ